MGGHGEQDRVLPGHLGRRQGRYRGQGRLDAEHGMKRCPPPSEARREQGSGMRPSLAAGGKTRAHSIKVRVSDAAVPHLGARRSHFWVRVHTRTTGGTLSSWTTQSPDSALLGSRATTTLHAFLTRDVRETESASGTAEWSISTLCTP